MYSPAGFGTFLPIFCWWVMDWLSRRCCFCRCFYRRRLSVSRSSSRFGCAFWLRFGVDKPFTLILDRHVMYHAYVFVESNCVVTFFHHSHRLFLLFLGGAWKKTKQKIDRPITQTSIQPKSNQTQWPLARLCRRRGAVRCCRSEQEEGRFDVPRT